MVKSVTKLYERVGDATRFERSENRVYSFIALLFTLLAAATKSVTLTEAFLELLPSLFLGHLLYLHITYKLPNQLPL